MGDAVTTGPVVMVVSVTEQRGYVYRNGVLIGATTVSTGRPGHLTPTGVFTVLQKQKEHRSTIWRIWGTIQSKGPRIAKAPRVTQRRLCEVDMLNVRIG
jgi:lipoprotein-anchoring transpeptidase ErfK/SrfK